MTAANTDGTLYAQEVASQPNDGDAAYQKLAAGTTFFSGKMYALYSQCLSATAGGAGDTVSFMKLPKGTVILGGWFYFEDGLGADDDDSADLGIVYEAGDGTDDIDALGDGIDIYDGNTAPVAVNAAIPAGSFYPMGITTTVFPYKVTGGVGTVTLTTLTDAIVAAKDMKICLYVILPGK